MHIFAPSDDGFYDSTDWVEVNGVTAPADYWYEASCYAAANDLWEPCSHGWECWLE